MVAVAAQLAYTQHIPHFAWGFPGWVYLTSSMLSSLLV